MSLYRPFDFEFQQNPYAYYADLPPIYYAPEMRGWVISRYEDVRYALENPQIFSSSIMQQADKLLLGADAPLHTHTRRFINQYFTRQRVRELEPLIQHIADEVLMPLIGQGKFDVIGDFADVLTIRVIAYILGIDAARSDEFISWSHAYIGRFTGKDTNQADLLATFESFFSDLITQRQAQPQQDFISHLAVNYPPEDVLKLSMLLLVAGNETTRNLIGNAIRALAENFNSASHDDIPAIIQETLRYDSPTQMILRITTQSITLHDVTIPSGAMIMLILGAANRDEEQFTCPHQFDPQRDNHEHLAFGHGAHYCLGAQLAIAEATIALKTLLQYPLKVLSPYEIADSIQLRGLKRLMVQV